MIIKVDAGQLEWRTKVFMAQDPVAMAEIIDTSRDLHSENQEVFKLPTRTMAKQYLFRMIFANAFGEQGFSGPAFAFSKDPNFAVASTSPKYWEAAVERFFDKYQGVYKHSLTLVKTGCETGRLVSPSGREYVFKQYRNKRTGILEWPLTQMLNYPIQGFSADLMILVRRIIAREWPYFGTPEEALLINTVHDDVEGDVLNTPEHVQSACVGMQNAFLQLAPEAARWYGVDLNLPFTGEAKFGLNLYEDSMSKYKEATFLEDFYKICPR